MTSGVKLYENDGQSPQGYPVKLILTHLGKTRRRILGYSHPTNWDPIHQIPLSSHGNYESLYGQILDLKKKGISPEFLVLEDLDLALEYLLGSEKKIVRWSLEDYFSREISRLEELGREGTADKYRSTQKQFRYLAPGVALEDITPIFIETFKKYKSGQVSDVTLGMYLSVLRALYNKAVIDPQVTLEDRSPFTHAMAGLVIRSGRKRQRHLQRETLASIERVVFTPPEDLPRTQRRALALGLLQFYLGGAALKDIYYLKRDQFFDDRVMITRAKLGRAGREFDLKVFKKTREVIDLLSGEDPLWCFPWSKDHRSYKIFRTNNNRSLRAAASRLEIRIYPIDQALSSYIFRHSFATLGKYAFVDPDIIRELMGHERGDIDSFYKDRYPQKVRDAAHFKIITV